MVQQVIRTSDLQLLNELSYILDCIASEYTGEAKHAIGNVKSQFEKNSYPLHTNLLNTLDDVHELLQNTKVTRAAKTLTPLIRKLWSDVLS